MLSRINNSNKNQHWLKTMYKNKKIYHIVSFVVCSYHIFILIQTYNFKRYNLYIFSWYIINKILIFFNKFEFTNLSKFHFLKKYRQNFFI